ncbi:hypothetical protein F2Q69_00039994 [Brassica cretica]|uniref:Uncharacterized protein n=1 Tax=Brassica cretica TaxID=69181 RepID=A0A8S9NBU4_BRACR|nr:hypothetical protein F2Q69_00039994 [Brassica cretica]
MMTRLPSTHFLNLIFVFHKDDISGLKCNVCGGNAEKKMKKGRVERLRSERNERLEHELELGDELTSASFEAYHI